MPEDVEGHGIAGNVNENVAREDREDTEGHGLPMNVNENVAREDREESGEVAPA
jgi:hypothetical protein